MKHLSVIKCFYTNLFILTIKIIVKYPTDSHYSALFKKLYTCKIEICVNIQP